MAAKKAMISIIKDISKDKPLYIKQWIEREYLDWLVYLHYENGEYQNAINVSKIRLKKKWETIYGKLASYLLLADAYFKNGDKDKAKQTLEDALKLGVSRKEPSALSALEKLRDYYDGSIELKPLYIQAFYMLCALRKIKIPLRFKNMNNIRDLFAAVDWVSTVKSKWF